MIEGTQACAICGATTNFIRVAQIKDASVMKCPICEGQSYGRAPTPLELATAYHNFNAGQIARQCFDEYLAKSECILRSELKYFSGEANSQLTFFDYGCGGGHFVMAATKLGYRASGMEFDSESVNAGVQRGLEIVQGSLPENLDRLAGKTFHVVKCMHVLEHVIHPARLMQTFHEILRPRGLLILSVPDQDSFPSRLKRALRYVGIKRTEYGFIQPPIHLHGFNCRSIEKAAEESNFDVVALRRTSALDQNVFPTSTLYWQGIKIQEAVYQLGRWFQSPGHITAYLQSR